MQKGLFSFTKKHFCLVAGLLCVQFSSGQGLLNNGAQIVITNTSNIHISGATGNVTNQAGGTITNNSAGGKIILGGNWVNNAVISIDNSTVEFNGATAQSIEGSNATAFYNINALGAGTKTFNTASTVSRLVTVGDNTTLNANGNLKLLSTINSNASVGPLLNGAFVTNNTVVQSFFTGENSLFRGFRGVSSPINDALIAGDKTYKQLQSKMIITGPGGPTNGFDKGNSASPFGITVKTYNESVALSSPQFTNLAAITEATVPGQGFFLFFRGDRSNYDASGTYATGTKISAPFPTPEHVIMEYTGPINQGDINVSLSYTNNNDGDIFIGSNLVGNPYPSVIDWHAVKAASTGGGADISPNIYVIKQDGAFAIYNSTTQDSTDGGTRYIMPGQAFYVKANATSQTLTFTESCKVPYPTLKPVMRLLSAPQGRKDVLGGGTLSSYNSSKALRFTLKNAETSAESLIRFVNAASTNYDLNDALYFSGGPLILCSKSTDNKMLAMNYLPEPTASTEISLYVSASQFGHYSLNFIDVTAASNAQVFLHDSFLSKVENIQTNSSYEFDMDKAAPKSYGGSRFKLVFKPDVLVPTLKAKRVYGGSEINWAENNSLVNTVFVLERSVDGRTFEPISTIERTTGSSAPYTFVDSNPSSGLNYYRLKLLEPSGLFSYSNQTTLNYAQVEDDPNFMIHPNPVRDALNVTFKQDEKKAVLTIFSINGQAITTFSVSNTNKASYNLADLQSGVYFLRVMNDQNVDLGSVKFIKE